LSRRSLQLGLVPQLIIFKFCYFPVNLSHFIGLIRHCGISSSFIEYHGNDFDIILKNETPSLDVITHSKNKYIRGCGEEENSHVIKTFEELCREIRGLKQLPLVVNTIHGVDTALRFTEVRTFPL
jgi:Nrap protein.